MTILKNVEQLFPLFATCPKGLELLLVDELRQLGAIDVREKLAGVTFKGNLSLAYQACLWSRLANRILLPLLSFPANTAEALYRGVQKIDWSSHVEPEGSIAVHFISNQSAISHTLFGAQKVKDAIVDQFRNRFNTRPSVDKYTPDINVYVYLHKDEAAISLDLSGTSLHKRAYRQMAGLAPIKENLAAAVLLRANWPMIAKQGGTLIDPMCGSGTLLIEGAMIAADIAPGLQREYFGFLGWKQHQHGIWQGLVKEAEQRAERGLSSLPRIIGYDYYPQAIHAAFQNIDQAGLHGKIHVEKREINHLTAKYTAGLVVVNPPYGERLGELDELQLIYATLGERLRADFRGWQAAIITGNPELGKKMGIRAKRHYALFNGALACRLLLFEVSSAHFIKQLQIQTVTQ